MHGHSRFRGRFDHCDDELEPLPQEDGVREVSRSFRLILYFSDVQSHRTDSIIKTLMTYSINSGLVLRCFLHLRLINDLKLTWAVHLGSVWLSAWEISVAIFPYWGLCHDQIAVSPHTLIYVPFVWLSSKCMHKLLSGRDVQLTFVIQATWTLCMPCKEPMPSYSTCHQFHFQAEHAKLRS